MNKSKIKSTLLEMLSSELSNYGFKLNKSLADYTKKTVVGWDKFQLIFLDRNVGWEINLGMLIRINEVENIYHKASSFDEKYHCATPTIGITLEKYINNGNEYRFYLEEDKDIEICYTNILSLFKGVVLPFFDKYYSLKELDAAVNVKNGTSIFSGLKYEGNVGLILARLVNNPDYDFFVKKYWDYYTKLNDGFFLPEYRKLMEVLKTIKSE